MIRIAAILALTVAACAGDNTTSTNCTTIAAEWSARVTACRPEYAAGTAFAERETAANASCDAATAETALPYTLDQCINLMRSSPCYPTGGRDVEPTGGVQWTPEAQACLDAVGGAE